MSECYMRRRYANTVKIVDWATGTDAEIAAMLTAAYAGKINLYDYWDVGDERVVAVDAIPANASGAFISENPAQNLTFVLMNKGYMEQNVKFVVGTKECLVSTARFNPTATSAGSWASSAMRTDINNLFYNALPSAFKALFKDITITTATEYNASTVTTTTDKFALFAEKELFGTRTNSNQTEADALSQIKYYETAANRVKTKGGSSTGYSTRSPNSASVLYVCGVQAGGQTGRVNASTNFGVAPFGCI